MATEFEITARWKKATAFAAHLYSHGILTEEVDSITGANWCAMAKIVRFNSPGDSGETIHTIKLIMLTFESAIAIRIAEEKQKEHQR